MASLEGNEKLLAEMAATDPDEPITMLNLLKYRETAAPGFGVDGLSGREAYEVYGKRFAALQPHFGGEPIWMGQALRTLIGDEDWDLVIVVRYPTRRRFLEMIADPDYRKIAPVRTAALANSRLVEMKQLMPKA